MKKRLIVTEETGTLRRKIKRAKQSSGEKLLTRQEKKELLASKYGLDLKKMRYNNEGSSDVDSWVYSDGSFFICFANGSTFTPPSNQRQSA